MTSTAADVLIDTIAEWGVDHRHMVGTSDSGQARPDAVAFWEPGINGERPSVCDLGIGSLSEQSVHCIRRRRRFLDADGGVRHLVKYRLPTKVVIIKNNSLGMIKWEQMIFLRNPEYGCDMQLIDFAGFTRACGETGFTIEDPSECGAILDQARAIPGPVIVEAGVEPIEPPMPPKLPLEQAT